MYDAVEWQAIPDDSPLVAGYIDGRYAWPPEAWAKFKRQGRRAVGITVFASVLAGDVLDVEITDATPQQMPGWVLARRAGGAWPTVYMNESTWPECRGAWAAQAPGHPEPPWWVAFYNFDAAIPDGAVAHQFANPPRSGGNFDRSSVLDHWPGVDPDPTPPAPKKRGKTVWILSLPNASVYATDGVWFRWLNGAEELNVLKYSIAASGGTVFEGQVARWQTIGLPADPVSAQAVTAATPDNPCPWPPKAA